MKFICIRKCYTRSRLWKPGMVMEVTVPEEAKAVSEKNFSLVKKVGKPVKEEAKKKRSVGRPRKVKPTPEDRE